MVYLAGLETGIRDQSTVFGAKRKPGRPLGPIDRRPFKAGFVAMYFDNKNKGGKILGNDRPGKGEKRWLWFPNLYSVQDAIQKAKTEARTKAPTIRTWVISPADRVHETRAQVLGRHKPIADDATKWRLIARTPEGRIRSLKRKSTGRRIEGRSLVAIQALADRLGKKPHYRDIDLYAIPEGQHFLQEAVKRLTLKKPK